MAAGMEKGTASTENRRLQQLGRQRAPSPLELGGVQGQTVRLSSRSVERNEQVRHRTAQVNARVRSLDVRMQSLESKLVKTAESQEKRYQNFQKYLEDLSKQSEAWVASPSKDHTPAV